MVGGRMEGEYRQRGEGREIYGLRIRFAIYVSCVRKEININAFYIESWEYTRE